MSVIQRSLYFRNYIAVTGSAIAGLTGSKCYGYNGPIPTSPNSALGSGVTNLFIISDDGGAGGLSFQAATPTNDGNVYKDSGQTWKEDVVVNPSALQTTFARFIDGVGNILLQMPAVTVGEGLRMAELTPPNGLEQPITSFQAIFPSVGLATQESLLLRQYVVATGSYRDALTLGKIKIYADSVPASIEDAIGSQELLVTITNNSTATGLTFEAAAVNGALVKTTSEVWSGLVANPSAKAHTFWRFEDSGGNAMLQGEFGVSGTTSSLSDLVMTDGETRVLTRFAHVIPE